MRQKLASRLYLKYIVGFIIKITFKEVKHHRRQNESIIMSTLKAKKKKEIKERRMKEIASTICRNKKEEFL